MTHEAGASRRLRAARVLGGLAVLLLGAECAARGVLQRRPDLWRPGAAVRVLLLGDSIPFGSGVEAEQAFPARLQLLLDERAPGRFSIINLAVPGMNTAQVRRRLASRVARYDPNVVIAMVGANNGRNGSEQPDGAPPAWGAALCGAASRSALVRLATRGAEGGARAETRADGRHQLAEVTNCRGDDCDLRAIWHLRHGTAVETIEMRRIDAPDPEGARRRARDDYLWMHRWLAAAGIPLALVTYPHDGVLPFRQPNRALAEVAELGVLTVDTSPALGRASGGWVSVLHPGPKLHAEIARELLPVLESISPAP